MLEKIASPDDVKKLSEKELDELAAEIRQTILSTVSRNGGHLASNLGMVEATIVLHRIFSSPDDKIVFDVGHQCYAHKLLTGRYERFSTLRQYGGVSGFQNRKESGYDVLTEGHCGTSLSAALGIAVSNQIAGNERFVVAVVGDGALTNGMIYEALNNCSERKLRLIILLNDNDKSISDNIGGLHTYLCRIRTSKKYNSFKHGFSKFLSEIPLVGKWLFAGFRKIKNLCKRIFLKNTIFEDLGLDYLGPVDGHNMRKLTNVLQEAKRRERVCIVHIKTKKGKGYPPAESEPDKYHSVGALAAATGASHDTFSDYAGKMVCARAAEDGAICAITAAMRDGVGLTAFSETYPDRFFDVGIAEEHAVTFAGGLAVNGMKPVLFLYSTFAQRSYDQFLHDISIQNLPMTLMLDRCGIVPGDGITHQGIFDYPLLSAVPGVRIYAPATYAELETAFGKSFENEGLTVIRYPKGPEISPEPLCGESALSYSADVRRAEAVIVTYGRLTEVAWKAAERLKGKEKVGVVKLFELYPLDASRILSLTENAKLVYVLEEGYRSGGVSEKIASLLACNGYKGKTVLHAVDAFVEHGSLKELFEAYGFTAEAVAERIGEQLEELRVPEKKTEGSCGKRL